MIEYLRELNYLFVWMFVHTGREYDDDLNDEISVQQILRDMLDKKVVEKDILNDLGFDGNKQRKDPRPKMELRHKQVLCPCYCTTVHSMSRAYGWDLNGLIWRWWLPEASWCSISYMYVPSCSLLNLDKMAWTIKQSTTDTFPILFMSCSWCSVIDHKNL